VGAAICAASCALVLIATPASAASKARITGLSDVAFGTIANLGVDAIRTENVCVYSTSTTSGYNVTASGTGPSGAFQLASGTRSMPFEVQWSGSPGQTSGTTLSPNVPLTGQVSTATQQACSSGPSSSASLVVVLRSAALSSATAGTYNGTLTLVVGPE
jgi:spore coat protein U-like protein